MIITCFRENPGGGAKLKYKEFRGRQRDSPDAQLQMPTTPLARGLLMVEDYGMIKGPRNSHDEDEWYFVRIFCNI